VKGILATEYAVADSPYTTDPDGNVVKRNGPPEKIE